MIQNITDKVYCKMKNCIYEHNMLLPGEAVIACVSGGCDSVALLFLLNRFIQEENMGRKLVCAHFDHMLRGAESDEDRDFTEKLCKSLNIEFRFKRQDVAAYSKEYGLSLETGARDVRYGFFQELADEYGGKIAVAHNLNDRVETILMNIARGTGIHGLKGISYARDNIIRPILDIERSELEKVLEENNIAFRTDSTNKDPFCKRNKVRLDVLPYLRKNLGEDIDRKLIRLSVLATEDNEYIESVSQKYVSEYVQFSDGCAIVDYDKLCDLDKALLSRISVSILKNFYPGGVGITENAVNDLKRALESKGAGYSGTVGKGIYVRVYHDRLVVSENCPGEEFSEQGMISYYKGDVALSEIRESDNMIAAFDENALDAYCREKNRAWEIRCRKEGDRFTPLGSKGGKLLKKFFIDNKVPADIRNTLPLLAVGQEILWIPGVRRSNIAPVTKDTTDAILFKFRK
ncbi:MAG: tRNA lysidine(34) synthetase TilS [Ruminococcaceae bacterium]|nr:tRNA lysidine(34) synthetase TilS [Oscillospiraceae bacterium]